MTTRRLRSPALLAQRVEALTACFIAIQSERMAGIPVVNPALRVEAVGFSWGDLPDGEKDVCPVAEGILITPWFMSLLRLPAEMQPCGQVGRSRVHRFGGEFFDFIEAYDPVIGSYESCALFSPMTGFTNQELARETATASLALVRGAPAVPTQTVAAVSQPARRAFFLGRRTETPS